VGVYLCGDREGDMVVAGDASYGRRRIIGRDFLRVLYQGKGMEVVCKSCNRKFRISDEKLPKGKMVSLTCPKCKSKISVDRGAGVYGPAEEKPRKKRMDEGGLDDEAFERPFDFIEEGVKTALLCQRDKGIAERVKETLKLMEYHVTEAYSAQDALKKMRFHVYDLVVLDEGFDGDNYGSNRVQEYLNGLLMSTRRNIFVVLMGEGFRTMDNLVAFGKSVNLVINTKDIENMGKILKRALNEHEEFYRVFKESIVKAGRG